MNRLRTKRSSAIVPVTWTGLLAGVLFVAGCDRSGDIRVQRTPKESAPATVSVDQSSLPPMTAQANPHGGGDVPMTMGNPQGNPQPRLRWTLPKGWQEKPASGMRAASFTVPGMGGEAADVSAIPLLNGGPETELAVVNMWRGEAQLPPVDKVESTPVAIGSAQGKLFEIVSQPDRILAATLVQGDMAWYFKMKGPASVVSDQKRAFVDWLKSIAFVSPAETSTPAEPPPTTTDASPAKAGLPAGWQEVPPTQMLLAKYVIQGAGEARAEVTVSQLAGTGGGLLPNVNRWRNQLGLPPVGESELSTQATPQNVGGTKATLVELRGTDARTGLPARLVALILPATDATWFYKLMGNETIVEQQKEAFTKFVASADRSHAP